MQFHCIFCKSICDIFKAFPLGRRQPPQSLCDSSPFMGAFQNSKAVPEREGGKPKGLKALQMDLRKMQ